MPTVQVCDQLGVRRRERMGQLFTEVPMGSGSKRPADVAECGLDALDQGIFMETLPPTDQAEAAALTRVAGVEAVYVVHYTKLRERLRHVLSLVKSMGLGTARVMFSYDREDLTEEVSGWIGLGVGGVEGCGKRREEESSDTLPRAECLVVR